MMPAHKGDRREHCRKLTEEEFINHLLRRGGHHSGWEKSKKELEEMEDEEK